MTVRLSVALLAVATVTALGPATSARGAASADMAGELAALMTQQKLEAFAVQDPEQPGRFLAALLIPQVQLLVVSAEYAAPAELTAQLAARNYRDVYAALHQPGSAPSRFFLIDLGCDGLAAAGGGAVDVLYEKGTTQTLFNGDWKSQALTERDYRSRVQDAERRYGRILGLLTASLKAPNAG